MMTLQQLLSVRCQPLEGHAAMTAGQVQQHLQLMPQWAFDGSFIHRTYHFGNYYETVAFVNALAYVVHAEDHHPDLAVGYNRCEVKFNTHSVGGISVNDFICAAKIDALYNR
jgi:4a-hydroxytetrahydrobiopterin dehydratase